MEAEFRACSDNETAILGITGVEGYYEYTLLTIKEAEQLRNDINAWLTEVTKEEES